MHINTRLLLNFFSSLFNPPLLFTSFYFLCSCLFFPVEISATASILVMAADSFAFALKAEKNSGWIMAQIGRSLLSAFHRIKRACVRDTELSVAQPITEVNLNQPCM